MFQTRHFCRIFMILLFAVSFVLFLMCDWVYLDDCRLISGFFFKHHHEILMDLNAVGSGTLIKALPNEAIWWYGYRSTPVQIMVCCLTTPVITWTDIDSRLPPVPMQLHRKCTRYASKTYALNSCYFQNVHLSVDNELNIWVAATSLKIASTFLNNGTTCQWDMHNDLLYYIWLNKCNQGLVHLHVINMDILEDW